jgi:succinate dehydrogenase / fumarate reductase cytochrome b subunit
MSITHRASGVFLSIIGAPLLMWWLIAVSSGPEAYDALHVTLGGWIGKLVVAASILCLSFHLLNGIRHLLWDTGRALDIKTAYTAGWLVLIGTVVLSGIMLGVLL